MIKFKRLNIHVFSLIAICALLYADFSVYTLLVFVSALLHELGHIIMLSAYHVQIHEINIYPFGADIKINNSSLTYKKELMIALMGPIFNFSAAAFAFLLIQVSFSTEAVFFFFANALLGFVNLLPIKTLDGGRALECILCQRMALSSALTAGERISTAFFILLTALSFFVLAATEYNVSFMFICAYLFASIYIKDSAYRYHCRTGLS